MDTVMEPLAKNADSQMDETSAPLSPQEEIERLKLKISELEANVHGLYHELHYWRVRSPFFYVLHPRMAARSLYYGLRYHCFRRPKRFLWERYVDLAKGGKHRLGVLQQYEPKPVTPESFPPIEGATESLPKVSIVTPSYNQAEFIGRTMDSVLNQGYPAVEYLVMDGASKDATPQLLAERAVAVGERMIWVSEKDNGQADAVGKGLGRTTGEIMAWLNSDDVLMPGALPFIAEYFRKNPEVDVVYGHRIIIDEHDREIGRWVLPPYAPESLTFFDYIPQETLFWRRRAWEKVGGIDASFHFALDWDLLVRFRDAGCRIVRLPYFTGAFRVHSSQKTSSQINTVGLQEMNRVKERTGATQLPPRVMHHAVLKEMFRSRITQAALDLGVRSTNI
jgi:cellulose synthase/poly-beta-1,6-N-acetylglucosamine synthase-like glycosyltransferase